MRIIGGKYKGRKIFIPDKNTRPLRDMVKESIFNLIEHSKKIDIKIENSRILDLFSGSGSFGLECLSRKAQKILFVENNPDAVKILKKNILHLKVIDQTEIKKQNCFNYLDRENNFSNKFKIIFIDPPFKEEKINNIINVIKNKKILDKNGIIIIHRHKSDGIKLSQRLNILDTRSYGISKIIFGN